MTDIPLDVVTGIAATATVALGAATVWLARTTRQGLDQQREQAREAERNAVLPFPVLEGSVFFPEAVVTHHVGVDR